MRTRYKIHNKGDQGQRGIAWFTGRGLFILGRSPWLGMSGPRHGTGDFPRFWV